MTLGSRTVTTLDAGAAAAATPSFKIPSTTALNDYYVVACADDTLQVSESDEGNNCSASSATVAVTRPDLVVAAVTDPPAYTSPGKKFTATDSVVNQGGYVSTTSGTRYYLSLDDVRSAGDILLTGHRPVPALAPTAVSTGASESLTVPGTTALGLYFLVVCVDENAKNLELSETNNCAVAAAQIRVGRPDLSVSDATNPAADIVAGKTLSVTSTVTNQGTSRAATSTTRYYFSTDAGRDPSDILLAGATSVIALIPGQIMPASRTVTVPTSTPTGTYRVSHARTT